MGKMIRNLLAMICVVATLLCFMTVAVSQTAESNAVAVFAAASTTNAINEIAKLFESKGLGKVTLVLASSSTLAKQIEKGAPANVFISADEPWMNYLEKLNLIQASSRVDLLGNSLVLIAPVNSRTQKVDIKPKFDLVALLGDGRLAVGDPDHVPAGKYAKGALQKLDVWTEIESKLARAADVRGALKLVEHGETPFGIVYSTDAAITTKVKVVGMFPSNSHSKIIYPAALVTGKVTPAAKKFLDFLKTPEAKAIFEKYGFVTL